jgi:hypothetical protein
MEPTSSSSRIGKEMQLHQILLTKFRLDFGKTAMKILKGGLPEKQGGRQKL